jgi:hypothetical protein
MMKTSFYNLIVISPDDPRILKFHISRYALLMLFLAFVISFLITLAVSRSIGPEKLNNAEHVRLRAENLNLEVANKNAEIRNKRLEAELMNLEKLSDRVTVLMETR